MTAEYSPPHGPRYSQLFLERYRGQTDSKKLRKRIICLFDQEFSEYENMVQEIGQVVQRRLGVDIQYNRFHGNPMLTWFFTDCKISELNDAVTIIAEILKLYKAEFCDLWLRQVSEIYREEGMPYKIVGMVVEPYIDEVFSHGQVTLLKGLQANHLEDVRARVSGAFQNLRKAEIDTKAAVISMVDAVDGYLKLKFDLSNLSVDSVKQNLHPKVGEIYGEDKTALNSANHMIDAFCNWIGASQQYSPELGSQEDECPSMELAVLLVDQGVGYLRWLLDVLEEQKHSGP